MKGGFLESEKRLSSILQSLLDSYNDYKIKKQQIETNSAETRSAKILRNFLKQFAEDASSSLSALLKQCENGIVKELRSPDDSLALAGHAMHLSTTRREEHISGWLGWVLGLHLLSEYQQIIFYKVFLAHLVKKLQKRKYWNGDSGIVIPEELNCPKIGLEVGIPVHYTNDDEDNKRLDLVVYLKTVTLIIEVKAGDKNIEKNKHYKEYIGGDGKGKFKNPICVLLIPEDDLLDLEDETAEDAEAKLRTGDAPLNEAALTAFPPITWEDFIVTLRQTIHSLEEEMKDSKEWGIYKILAGSFFGFIECEILGFDLKSIKKTLHDLGSADKVQPTSAMGVASYLKFRRQANE